MENSRLLDSSVRHKIFEQWPKRVSKEVEQYQEPIPKKKKRNQSLKAQQALEKSLLFLNNIKTFLSEMDDYEETFNKNERELNEILCDLEEINSNNQKKFSDHDLTLRLKDYYKKIKETKRMGRSLESFSLANLANFDRQSTSLTFTRKEEEAHQQLLRKINDLEEKRRRVQQTLVGYQYGMPQSQILGDQNRFQKRLHNLIVGINQDNTIQFHYLMIYELRRVENLQKRNKELVAESQENFSRFEGLSDSMNLMRNQIREMRNDRKEMQNKFFGLTLDNAEDLIEQSFQGKALLENNGKVYQANMSLLARYSAETNLKEYEDRRRIYATQLNKFSSTYGKWIEQQKYVRFLYRRHEVINNYRKRQSLAGKEALQREKQELRMAYLECLQYEIPKEMKSLTGYKYLLVQEMQRLMKEGGIAMQKRGQTKNDTYRKYFDFFVQMEFQEIPQKIPYLIDNTQTIDALTYEIRQESQLDGHTLQAQKYKFGLLYAQLIANYACDKGEDQLVNEINKHSMKRWQALPIGFESVFFNFVYDLEKKKQFFDYLQEHAKEMKKYSSKIREDIERIGNWENYVETSQIAFLMLKNQPADRRDPYKNFIRKISRYSPHIRDQMEEQYWSVAEKAVRDGYQKILHKVNIQGGIDKQQFFTCKILCYLTQTFQKHKVSNIDELLEFFISTCLANFANKWTQRHFFVEIIKMRLLLDYLVNTLSEFKNVNTEISIVKNILWATLRLYEVNDHLSLVDGDEIYDHIQHSLTIHRCYMDHEFNYDHTGNVFLQDKSRNLVGSMKKLPLVLGTKHEIKNYQNFFSLEELLQSTKELANTSDLDILFLSQTYVTCEELSSIFNNSEKEFKTADILSVKDNIQDVVYLEKMGQEANQVLKDQLDELSVISNIFKGQAYERERGEEEEEIESDLNAIIRKLKSMSSSSMCN